jgi:hypothetical protein
MLRHPQLDGSVGAGDEPPSPREFGDTPQTIISRSTQDTTNQRSVLGILNDWDMASELTDEGEVPNSAALHRTGTLPFMATELLTTPPPAHRYRHDLESFFYILIWAAVHYNLKGKTRRPTSKLLVLWGDQNQALDSKSSMFSAGTGLAKKNIIFKLVGREFQEVLTQWISPLYDLFRAGLESIPWDPSHPEFSTYDHATCNGRITFETFMAAIGIKPRSAETT